MRAAAVQLSSNPDRDRNLEAADRLTRAAAARGAELVVLPEKWPVLGTPEQTAGGAEPLDGPALSWARGAARELGIDLVAGSVAERVEGAERGANTSVHIGPDGEDRAVYRKIHMFDVEVGGRTYRERGAKLLTVPAAFTETTTRDHWEVLLRARAIENQCFVIAANQVGEPAPGMRTGGRSMIVDPWGLVLAQAPDFETFVLADLDFDRLDGIRTKLPSLANRQAAAYRWPEEARA
jgi:predicted amidohydrolase